MVPRSATNNFFTGMFSTAFLTLFILFDGVLAKLATFQSKFAKFKFLTL